MLNCGERAPSFRPEFGKPKLGETKKQRILAVFNQWNDKLL